MSVFFENFTDLFHKLQEKHNNRPFLKAAMAACALVSMSDGQVNFCDRIKLDQILDTLNELKIFDPHEGVDLFNYYSAKIGDNPKLGHDEALAAIEPVARDKNKAKLLIRLCMAISLSDGKTKLVEKIEIVSLCSLLGVDSKGMGVDMEELMTSVSPDIS